jgi:hypothetical protein
MRGKSIMMYLDMEMLASQRHDTLLSEAEHERLAATVRVDRPHNQKSPRAERLTGVTRSRAQLASQAS